MSFFEEPTFGGAVVKAPKAQVEDDGHSTSNKRVTGFGTFKDPRLWGAQGGKILNFDGSLE